METTERYIIGKYEKGDPYAKKVNNLNDCKTLSSSINELIGLWKELRKNSGYLGEITRPLKNTIKRYKFFIYGKYTYGIFKVKNDKDKLVTSLGGTKKLIYNQIKN